MAITAPYYLTPAQRDNLARETYVAPMDTRHVVGGSVVTDHYRRPDDINNFTHFRARMDGIEVSMQVPSDNVPPGIVQQEMARRMAEVRTRATDMALSEIRDLARRVEDNGRPSRTSPIDLYRMQEEMRQREMDMRYRHDRDRVSIRAEESQILSEGQAMSVNEMIKKFLKTNLAVEIELVKSDTQIEIRSVVKFKDTNEEISSDTSFIDLKD